MDIDNLTKRYAGRSILRQVSAQIAPGVVTAICGDNGAGKTTLLRCMAGLCTPDAGRIAATGQRYYLGEADHLYQHATVAENLALVTTLQPAARVAQSAIEALWQIAPHRTMQVRTLSRGQRRRVALCRAWLLQPAWLLLDEPLIALDESAQSLVAQAMAWITQRGCGVIVAVQQVPPVLGPLVQATVHLSGEVA